MPTTSKTALVTGSNKGIGHHIVRQLAQQGVYVYLAARDPRRGRAAAEELTSEGLGVEFVYLDVTDGESVTAAAEQVRQAHGRLDILVNNAAIISGLDPASTVRVADLRRTYETNVFGVVTVTNAFLPLLRASRSPRIVNVSSGLGSITLMADPDVEITKLNNAAYQSSKSALNALTVLYANELRSDGVKVNAVCPGARATELGGGPAPAWAGDPAEGAAVAVRLSLIGDDGPTAEFHADTGAVYPW